MRSWSVVRLMRAMGLGAAIDGLAVRSVRACSAMALLTIGGSEPKDYFLGGRAMERVWLVATSLGMAVQPMSALPYIFARLEKGGGFPSSETNALRFLRSRYLRLFHVKPGAGELLLFRIARAGPPSARALRRRLDDMLTIN
jgi:hypothetical protein